jgi:4-amino-4-deoxy-L-arabinose transferase-like glycosyltransferase
MVQPSQRERQPEAAVAAPAAPAAPEDAGSGVAVSAGVQVGTLGRGAMWGWALVLAAAFGFGLGGYPLYEPDEGRNAEVAREMTASGDFLVPRLDGLPYLDKPVLFFAAEAASFAALGRSEWAARLPPLVFAFATALLTAAFARRLYGGDAGWVAGTAALAAPLPLAFSRTVIFDSLLALLVAGASMAFYFAVEAAAGAAQGRRRYVGWTVLAWAAMGLGVLTKGPVALAVPLLAAAPYAIWRRASRAVWHPLGPAVLAALVAPWVAAMSRAVPDFLHYVLVAETWERVTTDDFQRTGPFWYFVPLLLGGALPWSVVALGGWRRGLPLREADGRRDRRLVFLALWIGLPFLLFSLSHSKRPQYILPLLPAVAVLAGGAWAGLGAGGGAAKALAAAERLPGARAGAAAWVVFGALLAGAGVYLGRVPARIPEGLTLMPATLYALAAVSAAGGSIAWAAARRKVIALVSLALPVAAMPLATAPILAQIGAVRSARDLAAAIAPRLAGGAQVVGVYAFPPSLPFYLGRPVLVVSRRGRELTSNYVIRSFGRLIAEPSSPLRPADWWRGALVACQRPWIFVVHADDEQTAGSLRAARLPALFDNRRFAAFGPCAPAAAGERR